MKLGKNNSDCLILRNEEPSSVVRDSAGVVSAFRVFKPGPLGLTIEGEPISGEITAADIRSILDHHALKGEPIPVDCEHLLMLLADLKGVDEADFVKAEPILGEKASAGRVRLSERNGELWATVEKWCDRARELLSGTADAMYYHFSPVLRGLKKNAPRLTSFALTNTPALNGLETLAASGERSYGFVTAPTGKPQTQGHPMKNLIVTLAGLLGLDAAAFSGEGVNLEPLLTAAAKKIETLDAACGKFVGAVKDALNLSDAPSPEVAVGLIASLATKGRADHAALADAQAKIVDFEKIAKTRLIAQLKGEGKLAEAQTAWAEAQDVAALSEFAKNAPVVVPLKRITDPNAKLGDEADAVRMTDADTTVARACGLDPAKVAATNKLTV